LPNVVPTSPTSVGLIKLAFTGLPNWARPLSLSLPAHHTTNSFAVVVVMDGADQVVVNEPLVAVADVKTGVPVVTHPLKVCIRAAMWSAPAGNPVAAADSALEAALLQKTNVLLTDPTDETAPATRVQPLGAESERLQDSTTRIPISSVT
jgi:hypothetical protein